MAENESNPFGLHLLDKDLPAPKLSPRGTHMDTVSLTDNRTDTRAIMQSTPGAESRGLVQQLKLVPALQANNIYPGYGSTRGEKKKKAVATHELNAVGNYWGTNGERSFWSHRSDMQKLEAAKKLNWFPDSSDFAEAVKKGQKPRDELVRISTTNDLLAKLGAQGETQPGSISKLNIFTHGSDQGEIILQGRVTADDVVWTARDINTGGFNDDLFFSAEDGTITFSQIKRPDTRYGPEDVRKAFSEDAEVTVYACHSAVDKDYLKKLSTLFGVPVRGFSTEVLYKISLEKGRLNYKLGVSGAEGAVDSFHDLDRFSIGAE